MRVREGFLALATILAATAPPALAIAQTQQQIDWCNGKNGATQDLMIGGCTALIQSGRYTGHELAIAFNSRGNAYYNKNDYDRAIADYNHAIRLDPKYAPAFYNRGRSDNSKKDYDRAIADFDQAIRLDPKFALAFNNRGYTYNSKGDYDRAIADLNQAIRLDPKSAMAFNNRGNAYESKKDYDHAIADYSQAIGLDPKYVFSFNNRGNAYYHKKDYDRAIADFDQAIRLDPKYARAFNGRGAAYDDKKDYDRAIADYTQAIQLDPKYAAAYNNRGLAYAAKGDYAHAIPDYNQVLKDSPNETRALQSRAKALAKTGDLTRAIQDQKLFIAIQKPTDSWPLITLAAYYRNSKQYDLSLATLIEAAKFDEDGPGTGPGMSIYYHRGWTLQLMGRHAEAIEAFTAGIAKQPDYYWARFRRALSYEKIGEREKALQDLKEAAAHIEMKYRTDDLTKKLSEYGLK